MRHLTYDVNQLRRAGVDNIAITGPIMPSHDSEGGNSPRYSEILSPAIQAFFSENARLESRVNPNRHGILSITDVPSTFCLPKPDLFQWVQPQSTPESGVSWKKMSPQMVSSPSQPYSLREALAQAQSARRGPSNRTLRESLHPRHRQKLVSLSPACVCVCVKSWTWVL